MRLGIKEKDIRDFEKYSRKLDEIIRRVREYVPEAHIYATPQQLNLMAGVEDSMYNRDETDDLCVTSVTVTCLECGDW